MKKIFLSLVILGSGIFANADQNQDLLSFKSIPSSPIVFLDAISIPQPGDKPDLEVRPSWFKMSFSVKNHKFDIYTLQHIKLNYYSSETGEQIWSQTLSTEDGSPFAMLNKGEEFTPNKSYYVDNLPARKNKNTKYMIDVEVIGWPGLPSSPKGRYELYTEIITQ